MAWGSTVKGRGYKTRFNDACKVAVLVKAEPSVMAPILEYSFSARSFSSQRAPETVQQVIKLFKQFKTGHKLRAFYVCVGRDCGFRLTCLRPIFEPCLPTPQVGDGLTHSETVFLSLAQHSCSTFSRPILPPFCGGSVVNESHAAVAFLSSQVQKQQ